MKRKSFLLGVPVFLAGLCCWLIIKLVIPVNPQYPYFPDKDDRVGGVHWNLGEFQPVYLYSFSNKDNYFIKVAYRDAGQKIKLMNVLVGKSGADSIPFSDILNAGSDVVKIGSIGEYGKYFKVGSRVHITYLRNVSTRPNDSLAVVEPNDENTRIVCETSKMLCLSLKLIVTSTQEFWNFPITKNFPNNLLFPGISLSKKLLN